MRYTSRSESVGGIIGTVVGSVWRLTAFIAIIMAVVHHCGVDGVNTELAWWLGLWGFIPLVFSLALWGLGSLWLLVCRRRSIYYSMFDD